MKILKYCRFLPSKFKWSWQQNRKDQVWPWNRVWKFKSSGILCRKWNKYQFLAPKTSQQNSVVERKNRSLVDIARTILIDASTSKSFWDKTINTACYVTIGALSGQFSTRLPMNCGSKESQNLATSGHLGENVLCWKMEKIILVCLIPRVMKEYLYVSHQLANPTKSITKELFALKKVFITFLMSQETWIK